MATSTLSTTVFSPLTISKTTSSSISSSTCSYPKLSTLSLPSDIRRRNLSLRLSSSRVFVAPEALEASADTLEVPEDSLETSTVSVISDSSQLAENQKIRIKLRSYWVNLINDSCKQIMDAARTTNAKIVGPVPLPTKRRVYCLLKSPHGHKDARFHFEIRTHQRLIDIHPTAATIDKLMHLDLPAGVDVEVKL